LGSPRLSVRDLRKRFAQRLAVDGVGFEIEGGEVYGLLGPNGAGKTTTICMIAGILSRDGGSVRVCGLDLDAGPPARRRIGLVPQEITLYPDLTGRENLEFWGRLYELRGAALRAATDAGLAAVGLAERADELAGTYSGGMLRRLNLVAGILHRPDVLIFDEPTAGVDPQSRSAIFELVEGLRARGAAILYTTHYMEEAERLCDRIGVIDAGRIVAEGTRAELVARLGRDVRIEVSLERTDGLAAAAELTRGLAGVQDARVRDGRLQIFADHGARRLPALLGALLEGSHVATAVEVFEPDLEDVFLHLTGRALRD
jgi:ABC-2 type transport system ATP-binding protein